MRHVWGDPRITYKAAEQEAAAAAAAARAHISWSLLALWYMIKGGWSYVFKASGHTCKTATMLVLCCVLYKACFQV